MAIIHLYNGTFYTDDDMFNAGWGACCECGTPNERSVTIACKRCNRPFIVIRDKYIPKHIAKKGINDNEVRRIKQESVSRLVEIISEEFKKKNISHLVICPHGTYLKIYVHKKRAGSTSKKLNISL